MKKRFAFEYEFSFTFTGKFEFILHHKVIFYGFLTCASLFKVISIYSIDIKMLSQEPCCSMSWKKVQLEHSLGKWRRHSIVQHVRFGSKQTIITLTLRSVFDTNNRIMTFHFPSKFQACDSWFYWSLENTLRDCFVTEWWHWVWMEILQLTAQHWKKNASG